MLACLDLSWQHRELLCCFGRPFWCLAPFGQVQICQCGPCADRGAACARQEVVGTMRSACAEVTVDAHRAQRAMDAARTELAAAFSARQATRRCLPAWLS